MSTHSIRRVSAAVALLAALSLASTAQAVYTQYVPPPPGGLVGPNITYLTVAEDTMRIPGPDPAQLFGPPTLSGNVLDFNPIGYDASAANGGSEMTRSLLQSTIQTNTPADSIGQLIIKEKGGYMMMGGSPLNSVNTNLDIGMITILAVNGVPLGSPINVLPTTTYSNIGSGLVTTGPFGNGMTINEVGPSSAGMWFATANFNVAGALAANGVSGVASKVELMINNYLGAQAAPGAANMSDIDKKDFYVYYVPVPEPSTLVLGGFGLIGLAFTARKVRKAKAA